MSIKQKQLIEYATQDLVAMLVEREGRSIQDAMSIVYHSWLHEKLQDVETGLYLEGSEYLYGLLMEERNPAPAASAPYPTNESPALCVAESAPPPYKA